jgi:signal transduction histidine kinase
LVEYDGVGFDVRVLNQKRNKGIGISGIQERVSQIEGSLEIESIKGKGTRVSLEVPLKLKIDC